KAVREARDAADRRRRQILEPRLLAAVHAEERGIEVPTLAAAGASEGSEREAATEARKARVAAGDGNARVAAGSGTAFRPFREAVGGFPAGRDRRVVEAILSDHAVRVRGVARERISLAFDALGYVDEYLAGLSARRWWRRADSAERLGLARSARAVQGLVLLI